MKKKNNFPWKKNCSKKLYLFHFNAEQTDKIYRSPVDKS